MFAPTAPNKKHFQNKRISTNRIAAQHVTAVRSQVTGYTHRTTTVPSNKTCAEPVFMSSPRWLLYECYVRHCPCSATVLPVFTGCLLIIFYTHFWRIRRNGKMLNWLWRSSYMSVRLSECKTGKNDEQNFFYECWNCIQSASYFKTLTNC
jgi:hypothetical protein